MANDLDGSNSIDICEMSKDELEKKTREELIDVILAKRDRPAYSSIPPDSPFTYTATFNLQYLQNLRNLTDRPKDIAIIGAGMAGLTAAWLLKRQGHAVTIFEAKPIVGGRVKTLREGFTSGFYAEAGAMRIPSHHTLVHHLIDRFKLKLDRFGPPKDHTNNGLLYINGHRITFHDYKQKKELPGFTLTPEEKRVCAEELFEEIVINYIKKRHAQKLGGQRLTKFADLRREEFPQDILYAIMNDLDQYSIIEFLTKKALVGGSQRPSQDAIDLMSTVMMWEMQMSSSMAAALSLEIELSADTFFQINGGMDYLPKGFLGTHHLPAESQTKLAEDECARKINKNDPLPPLPDLEENVIYNSRIINVYNEPPKLAVCYENTVTKHVASPMRFDIVVVAIPFSAIRHIRMPGLVTDKKRQAIRKLSYSNSCKIILEFSHRFWEDDLPGQRPIRCGGRSVTDLPIRCIYYPSTPQRKLEGEAGSQSQGGLVLASYTWGDDSIRWTSLSHSDRIRFALRNLEYVHDRNDDRLLPSCVGGMSHSWAEDEFTSGAFAQFGPYQRIQNFEHAWKPRSNIYFAGEHVSTKHGWIEGAIESGIRVACEIDRKQGSPSSNSCENNNI